MRIPLLLRPLAILALFLAGCGALTGPDEERRVGVIDFFDQPTFVVVPDTVRAGEDFEVSVVTYGNGCVTSDTTEVQVSDQFAQVVPYDIHRGNTTCPDVLRTFDHKARVRFDQAGAAAVRVVGKRMPENAIILVERPVVVEE